MIGVFLSITAFATSRLHIDKVQNIPFGKTVKINVDFQTVKTVGARMQPVDWKFKIIGNRQYFVVTKDNNKTLSVKNNSQSDDGKYVRIEIYDPSTQVSDTLRIRLLPQVFYHYTITASKDVGQNQHIWSIVDPNDEKSLTPRDLIIQALYIGFTALLDAHQKSPDNIKVSEEFLKNFGNSVNDLNNLSVAEKKQRIINMFKLIGVNQAEIDFANMLKLLDKLKLSHLFFTFPGITQSDLMTQPKEGFVVTKYKKNDWGSRAAPNRLAFGVILNNKQQLIRVVLVQPKDSESGVRILQSNTTGFGIVDKKDEGYYSGDNSESEDLDLPLNMQGQNQATKVTASKKTKAQLAQQKDIKLAAVEAQGGVEESKTTATMPLQSQPTVSRLAIADNQKAASQQYAGRQNITAAKALPDSAQPKVEQLNRNAVSNKNPELLANIRNFDQSQLKTAPINQGNQAPEQPKVTIPPPPPLPPALSTTENGKNTLSNQQIAKEVQALPAQNKIGNSDNKENSVLLASIRNFDQSKLNKASNSAAQKSVVTDANRNVQQNEGREGLLQQIRQGQYNLKKTTVQQGSKTSVKAVDSKAQQAKPLTPMELLKQSLSKRRVAMGYDSDKENSKPEQSSKQQEKSELINTQASPINQDNQVPEQPKVTIPPPPPLPPAPKLSTTADGNNLSKQEKTRKEEILDQGDVQKPNNTELRGSIENFNKDNLKKVSDSAKNNKAQENKGRDAMLQQIRQGQHNLKPVGLPEEKTLQRNKVNLLEEALRKAMEKRGQLQTDENLDDQDGVYQSGGDVDDWDE